VQTLAAAIMWLDLEQAELFLCAIILKKNKEDAEEIYIACSFVICIAYRTLVGR
jgi:hypothetical protein